MFLGVSPLTESEQIRLEDVADGAYTLETAGLTALLENVTRWSPGDADPSGLSPTGYDPLYAEPAAHRGEVFRVQGQLAQTQRRTLAVRGSWGRGVTEWTVKLPESEDTVLVLLPDRTGDYRAWPIRREVDLVGRFYKLWRHDLVGGGQADFLVFVAHHPQHTHARSADPGKLVLYFAAAALLGLVIWRFLRLRLSAPRGRRARLRRAATFDESPPDTVPNELAEDPAEALAQLAQPPTRERD